MARSEDVHASAAESVLQDLVPSNWKLEVDASNRVLILLSTNPARILAFQRFTRNQWSILLTILASYPRYAPYEILLASITSLSPTDCRKRLQEAQLLGTNMLKQELKPVYRALSGIRTKLDSLYPLLKISLIRNAGYALTTSSDSPFA